MPSQNWKFVCVLLCAVGFFKSMRPSEPFLTQYLVGPWINLTLTEVGTEVYPIATYTSLVMLFIVLIVTDYLRYKPIIILEAITFVATYVILIKGRSLEMMQLVEFMYAVSISCEVAYYTYMYTKVSDEHYQKVTSYARAAVLTGIFSAGVIGQILIVTKLLDYSELNYITLANACITLVLAFFLPKVPTSIYFHQSSGGEIAPQSSSSVPRGSIQGTTVDQSGIVQNRRKRNRLLNITRVLRVGFWTLWLDLKQSYSKPSVVKWSIWWAFGTCLNTQVIGYIQTLWEEIQPSQTDVNIYNGAVESASTFLGAVAALVVGFTSINWSLFGELAMAAVSVLDAACLCLLGLTEDIWVAYGSYVAFRVAYQLLITIASFQVARDLKPDTYSLIFGCNTFVALIIQTLLVLIVVDKRGLALDPREQFLVYSAYSLILGIVFFITAFVTCIRNRRSVQITGANDRQQIVN